MQLPILLNLPDARSVFQEVVADLPEDVDVYLIGGAIRNALYYQHFGERLRQRDYDQVATKNSRRYLDFLRSKGFIEGGIVRADQIILCKALVENPEPQGYDDTVVFDIHPLDGTTAIDNLKNHVGLSINGFALSLRDIYAPDWINRIIELPNAKSDLAAKQMRVNKSGYQSDPAYLFSIIRFMSAGFTPPPQDELKLLLNELPKLETKRFGKNIQKLYNYVGGEAKARRLAAMLGIKGDIFDEGIVKRGGVII